MREESTEAVQRTFFYRRLWSEGGIGSRSMGLAVRWKETMPPKVNEAPTLHSEWGEIELNFPGFSDIVLYIFCHAAYLFRRVPYL